MLKLRTLFSGVGAPESALKRLGIDFELVDFCEIDKHAIKSYCAIHGVDESKNLGDISKVWGRNLPYADLICYGFPCQDISNAGKMRGIVEGETRSGLLFEALRIIKETKPKYALAENVKNLVGKKFMPDFERLLDELDGMGYNNYWKVLNAKNYGIPQNRERVFLISIRKDIDNGTFYFPVEFDNGLRLKDMLEPECDIPENLYIPQEKLEKLLVQLQEGQKMNTNPSGRGMNGNVHTGEFAPTLTTNKGEGSKICIPCITPDRVNKRQNGRRFKEDGDSAFTLTGQDRHGILNETICINSKGGRNGIEGLQPSLQDRIYSDEGISTSLTTAFLPKILVKQATKTGYIEAEKGDSINIAFPNSNTKRGRVQKEIAGTLETSCNQGTLTSEYQIRKFTARESFRLMGFSDEEFERAAAVTSNYQLYKQAGNSIVTNVLRCIFYNLLTEECEDI